MVLCFTADEEAGGHKGAEYLVHNHSEMLADCTEAIGGWAAGAQRSVASGST